MLSRSNPVPHMLLIKDVLSDWKWPKASNVWNMPGRFHIPFSAGLTLSCKVGHGALGQECFPYFQASMRKLFMKVLSPSGLNAFHALFHLVFTPRVRDWWSLRDFRRSYKWWKAGKRFKSSVSSMPCYPGFLEQGRLKLGQTILPRLNEKVDGGHRKSAGERQFFFFLAASVLVWLVQVGTGLSGLKQCFSH